MEGAIKAFDSQERITARYSQSGLGILHCASWICAEGISERCQGRVLCLPKVFHTTSMFYARFVHIPRAFAIPPRSTRRHIIPTVTFPYDLSLRQALCRSQVNYRHANPRPLRCNLMPVITSLFPSETCRREASEIARKLVYGCFADWPATALCSVHEQRGKRVLFALTAPQRNNFKMASNTPITPSTIHCMLHFYGPSIALFTPASKE